MGLIGHMVVHNEFDRYVTRTLPALIEVCDRVVVVDDQSDDGTWDWLVTEILETGVIPGETVTAVRRPGCVPSFVAHEGRFRQWAWERAGEVATEGDWIISIDADEFLVPVNNAIHPVHSSFSLRERMDALMGVEAGNGKHSVFNSSWEFGVFEVFDVMNNVPMIRVDGFWGQINSHRMARWNSRDTEFLMMVEGCGSVPMSSRRESRHAESVAIMHYGYATLEDRIAKHDRYRKGSGHNRAHVASILQQPRLKAWDGPVPVTV